jgi:para-nitrobenzyl esterase
MTSPLSKGLFRRAIGESGTVFVFGDPLKLSQAEKRGESIAEGWDHRGASIKDLRAVSAADVLKAPNFSTTFPNLGITIDGYVLPKKPADVFATGKEHGVALLLGSNARERRPGRAAPTDLVKAIEDEYGPISGHAQTLYAGDADLTYGTPADQWTTDTLFRCPSVAQSAWHAAAGNPTFQYEFARVPIGREAVGATHASELGYVFGIVDQVVPAFDGPQVRANEVDVKVSELMQQYWTNFARTGDPNGGQLPAWPKFDASTRSYIQFTDAGAVVKEGLRRLYCDLFMENVKRLSAQ